MSASQMFIVVGLFLGTAVGVLGAWLPRPAKIPFRWVAGIFGVLLVVDVGFAATTPRGSGAGLGGTAIGTPQAVVSAPRLSGGGPSGSATSGAAPTATAPSSAPVTAAATTAAPGPDPLYLDTLQAVAGSGDTVFAGDANLRGEDFPHSVGLCADGILGFSRCASTGDDTWIEYPLRPGYDRLTATVGLSATSVGACRLHAQVLVDGTELWSGDVVVGYLAPFTVPVSGHRVRLQMHAVTGAGRCDLIYGTIAFHRG